MCDLGEARGRMIAHADRIKAIALISQAVIAGASKSKACFELGLSIRTYRRWHGAGMIKTDGRTNARRSTPVNALSTEEKLQIIKVCNQDEYKSQPPSQIVPDLADKGIYIASESSFYRVLRDAKQVNRRGRTSPSQKRYKPTEYKASEPNQGWSWDITFLPSLTLGVFFRLYMIMDIYSRKIIAWEVHEKKSAEYAAMLAKKACLSEGVIGNSVVLHSDNGSPMKGATMLATLQKLGVIPSFSRPSVSDDNPYSESLFKTLKYTPSYPNKPFADIEQARQWVLEFIRWYNHGHHHSAIRFVTR
jgi:putative transposase